MYSAKIGLSGVMVLLLASPLVAQSPGVLEGGTYNAPSGADAYTPTAPLGTPIAPFAMPGQPFGQPGPTSPPNLLNRDILNPNQWIWLQQYQRQAGKGAQLPPGPGQENRALIKVRVPTAETQLWVNDQLTRQKGLERVFITPPLELGTYRYRFRASWSVDRTPDSAVRTVTFQPDTALVIDFTRRSRPAAP
jgi:uncharacterized protein (TIGR03000 family)